MKFHAVPLGAYTIEKRRDDRGYLSRKRIGSMIQQPGNDDEEKVAPMNEGTKDASAIPLVVDLDGTLIKTDTLHEALVQLISRRPIQAFRVLPMLMRGRAAFKAAIAEQVLPDVDTLPVDEAVLEAINLARVGGRKVYLATAADRRIAEAIAGSICEFDGVFASADGINLKGKAKADRLRTEFGSKVLTISATMLLIFRLGGLPVRLWSWALHRA
jgi:hypothetical protein